MSMIAFLCSISLIVANPAPAPVPTSEEIREAIKYLDDPQYRVRALAAKKLLNAGKAAIEPLAKVAETGSIESADRAMKILQELAFNSNDDTMPPARDALHKLAKSKAQVREQAVEMLKRYRGQVIDRMQNAAVNFQFQGDNVRAIYLNSVQDLAAVLPLLREFPELEEISISHKKFGDEEFKHLLPLKKLKWINLFESNIGDDALQHLKNFPDLESIPMGHTRVTDAGLKHLAELTQLDYLGLRGNNVTDAGLVHLKKLTNLTGLTLQETKVTDAGLERLQGMINLKTLRLQETAITDAGLEKLHGLKSLRFIALSGTRVTDKGLAKLREAIPEAIVNRDGQ